MGIGHMHSIIYILAKFFSQLIECFNKEKKQVIRMIPNFKKVIYDPNDRKSR